MSLFSKKQKVPDLPVASHLPDLPDLPEQQMQTTAVEQKLPELPSFPVSTYNEKLNNEMVKSAVNDSSEEKEVKKVVEELPRDFQIQQEAFSEKPLIPSVLSEEKKTLEISAMHQSNDAKSSTKSYDPIFVKIDKFQSAQQDFSEIKRKMKEFDATLRKVKELKSKEDAEISAWTEEFENIKSKLAEIDSNIFNKL